MRSEYRSPKSVAKNQTIPIDAADPRLKKRVEGITRARAGAEIQIIGPGAGGSVPIIQYGSYISSNGGSKNPVTPPVNKPTLEESLTVKLGPISNLVVAWDTTPGSQDDLLFEFDFDPNDPLYKDNRFATGFRVHLTTPGGAEGYTQSNLFPIVAGATHHSYRFPRNLNTSLFGDFYTVFTFCVVAIDSMSISLGPEVCQPSPPYILTLEVPQIEVIAAIDGYNVKLLNTNNLSNPQYSSFEIWEVVSNDTTPPETGWTKVWQNPIATVKIGTLDLSPRWVKARFVARTGSNGGTYTEYSIAYKVTPLSGQGVDTQPPNEVTINSVTWDGDNIVINYSLPATEEANQFQIVLTAPNTEVGFFYDIPTYHDTTNPQDLIITKDKIYAQFSAYYSSYTGVLKSIDSNGNRSNGVSFTVPVRPNPLAGIVPTFELQALTNGYSVSWVQPNGAAYADVYELTTPWTADPIDESNRVYAGRSPAYVITEGYEERYIKIRYYDDYGNTSEYSSHVPQRTVVPIDPAALSVINNPVTFSTEGSILAGSSATVGARAIFNKDGFFIYDDVQTSPSTQIIGNASDGTPTFITEQAKIANWTITPSKIENLDFGTTGTYTGLSSSGTYAFWAGSPIAGGDSLAKFWVKPDGSVRASNISIVGGDLNIGGIFEVTSAGEMTASNANIIGNITATTGTFKGNVEISSAITEGSVGSLYSGTLTAPDVNGLSVISGDGFILNKLGISFFNSSTRKTFISNNSLSAFPPGTLVTTQAYIANWEVTDSEIKNQNTFGNVYLRAGATGSAAIYATPANGTTSAGILGPRGSDNSVALWAGSVVDPASITTTEGAGTTPSFYVTYNGSLVANKANIRGVLRGGTLTSADDTTAGRNGFYFDSTSGQFLLGGSAIAGTAYLQLKDGRINMQIASKGSIVLGDALTYNKNTDPGAGPVEDTLILGAGQTYFRNMSGDNFDDSKNDPTVVTVVKDRDFDTTKSYRVTRGRRFYWGKDAGDPNQQKYNYGVGFSTNPDYPVVDFNYAIAGDIFFTTVG